MTVRTRVAPDALFFALVDGTSEVDSVAFANNLTLKRDFGGWRNVLDFLDSDPFDETRLLDPAHVYLPIVKLDAAARPDPQGVAVVCPGGVGCSGIDEKWKVYDPSGTVWEVPPKGVMPVRRTYGRDTALEQSAKMIQDFLLAPAVRIDRDGSAALLGNRELRADDRVFRASLLYVSSHGWLGGFMRGEEPNHWPQAEPEQAREGQMPYHKYFVVGEVDKKGLAFSGPSWIVLGQCSTLNSATWAMWARVMARSDPPVRGILGYEESSPEARASIGIAVSFFRELRSGKSFLEAWQIANAGQHWAAIVHADALRDKLDPFPTGRLRASALDDYFGYLPSKGDSKRVEDPPPKFRTELFRIKDYGLTTESTTEVTPDTLDQGQATLQGDIHPYYVLRFSADRPFIRAAVRFVHIRLTYKRQFRVSQLFTEVTSRTPGARIDSSDGSRIAIVLASPGTSAEILVKATSWEALRTAGLDPSHSYLWPDAYLTVANGEDLRHQFLTIGLSFTGRPRQPHAPGP
jgi:hypothetical protein